MLPSRIPPFRPYPNRPILHPLKHTRYPHFDRTDRMTIAAGFVCRDGILLCADSLYSGQEKAYRDKLYSHITSGGTALGFAISGDVDYARTAICDCLESVSEMAHERQQDILSVKKTIRRAVKRVLRDYGAEKLDQFQKPDILIGIRAGDVLQLCSARDSAFPSIDKFECKGSGGYLASYMLSHIRYPEHFTITQILPWVVRALAAVKVHDTYCGGGSQFLAMRIGQSTGIKSLRIDEIDAIAETFDLSVSRLFWEMTRRNAEQPFDAALKAFTQTIEELRENLVSDGSRYRSFEASLEEA